LPRDPKIPGMEGHPNVLSYLDVLKFNKPVGKRVAIIGAGGIGFDVAEFLLHHEKDKHHQDVSISEFWEEWGIDPTQQTTAPGGLKDPVAVQHNKPAPKRQIHLLQRKKGKVGAGLGRTTGWIHRLTLRAGNVDMINGVTYDRVDEDGNLHYTKDGKQHVLEVDNIVLCAGQVERNELGEEAKDTDMAEHVYTIGGAYEAGELDAKRAIDMGTRLALKIHESNVKPGNHVFESPEGVEEKLFQVMRRFM
jgi:2,4-dienoyl-CoA reductase (NADPH2)